MWYIELEFLYNSFILKFILLSKFEKIYFLNTYIQLKFNFIEIKFVMLYLEVMYKY